MSPIVYHGLLSEFSKDIYYIGDDIGHLEELGAYDIAQLNCKPV